MKIVLPNQLNPVRDIIFSYYTDDLRVLEELRVPFAYRKTSIEDVLLYFLSSYSFEKRKLLARNHWKWVVQNRMDSFFYFQSCYESISRGDIFLDTLHHTLHCIRREGLMSQPSYTSRRLPCPPAIEAMMMAIYA